METGPSIPFWGIIIALLIILVNAYFSAARKSISYVNKGKIREIAEDGNKKAKAAMVILENLAEHKLAIKNLNILLYMLFCVCAIITFFTPVALFFENYLGWVSFKAVYTVSFLIVFFIPAVFLMAFGEMLPRMIAMQHEERIVLATAGMVRLVKIAMKPITVCTKAITFVFLKLFKQRTDLNDNEYSEEDIVQMLEAGQESGEIKEEGKKMIAGIFAFDDILAYEIMTPRTDVFAIDINNSADEYIDELMELRYSRIPVYEDDNDDIIGILYIKDYLIKARNEGFDNVDIRSILRKPYFVPETKNIDSLFFELQKTKQHIAILIDEYGGFSGIVTMEDLIEEVMGDIDDEYDEEEQEIIKIRRDLYIIDGSTDLDDINEELGTDLESENSETIGGFIIDMFGEIPDENDVGKEVLHHNFLFTIKSVKEKRIEQVSMKILPEEEDER